MTDICQTAGVGVATYRRALAADGDTRPSTLARLNNALHRFRVGVGAEAGDLAPAAMFKVTVALAALHMNANARAAIEAQPQRKMTADPVWQEAARCRQVAYHICNGTLGLKVSDIGRAAGVTKSAVSQAIRDLEDERDHDAALDGVLSRLEALLG